LLFIRYLGKQDQIWAKNFCILKNMHYRKLMHTTVRGPDILSNVIVLG